MSEPVRILLTEAASRENMTCRLPVMRAFIEHGHDSGRMAAIDWRDPADLLMAKEAMAGIDDDAEANPDAGALVDIPSNALLVILRFLVGTDKGSGRWRVASRRLAVLAHAAGLETVAELTLAQLADELKCTRALTSLYAVKLVDQLGMAKVRGGRSREARETYRQRAIEAHKAAGHTSGRTQRRKAFSE